MKPVLTFGLVVALASAGTGCASLRGRPNPLEFYDATPAAPESADCIRLDNDYVAWGAVAAVAGFLAGGGGVTAALPSDQTPRIALGLTSLGVGALSVVSTFLSNSYGSRYTATCTMKTSDAAQAALDRAALDEAADEVSDDGAPTDDGTSGLD